MIKWQQSLNEAIHTEQRFLFTRKVNTKEKPKHSKQKDAELWTLEMELEKGRGKNIAERSTLFPDFYRNWVETVKKNDVREATYTNYMRTLTVVDSLFQGVQLKHLDDIVMQKKLDHYAETHSKKQLMNLC